MEETRNKKIEVVYKKAKLGKRMFAYFVDISLLLLTSFIMFSIINIPVTNSSWFKSKQNELVQLRNESGLYIDGINIIDYVDESEEYPSYEDKKNFLSIRIDTFYQNQTYITDIAKTNKEYESRKLKAKKNGANLFIQEDDKVVENAVSAEFLYNFYVDELSNYTFAYLTINGNYFYLTRLSFFVSVIEFVSIFTFAFIVYFLILPLTCFRRGRQTIGMKIEKIGLVSIHAVNISGGKFVGRFVFNYVVFTFLNFVGFLIPSIISISMMYLNKTNSNLPNYVFNDYAVDVTDKSIYLNSLEREESEFTLQEMTIENKDFTLK